MIIGKNVHNLFKKVVRNVQRTSAKYKINHFRVLVNSFERGFKVMLKIMFCKPFKDDPKEVLGIHE